MTERRRGVAVWLATCGPVGHFPVAPGTAGSAVGVLLVVALGRLPLERTWLVAALAATAVALFALGVKVAGEAEKFFGQIDPRYVVIDEVVGQIITFLATPGASWKWLLVGFILFRCFDIIKPFPARRAERAPGGWGIMLDDVTAGVYSLMVLAALRLLIK